MVINLATTGRASFPIWMESHSGNASDKKILPNAAERMKNFCKQLSLSSEFIYVGDSAMYENMLKKSSDMKWLSRVPEKTKVAKQFIDRTDEELIWNILSEDYAYHTEIVTQNEVTQRWVLIFSKPSFNREISTLNKNIKKEFIEYNKIFWHLGNEVFSCQSDAQVSVNKAAKKLKYHQVKTKVLEIRGHKKSGRPKLENQSIVKGYRVECILGQDEEKISALRAKKGRFILASNELDEIKLPAADFLKEYKAQSGTESGFKFIKDDTFEVDSIFLKTPKRISALMMVMTLCLMVYGVSQYDLREKLKSAGKTVLNQLKKPTDKPTMKWVYFLFHGAHELAITFDGLSKQIVINVNAFMREIIGYFGDRAKAIYFNST
jgi:transposase